MTAAQKFAAYAARHNEGGSGYNPHAEEIEQEARAMAQARINHIVANMDSYKAKWMAALAKYSKGDKTTMHDVAKMEKEAGITRAEIQSAKARMAA